MKMRKIMAAGVAATLAVTSLAAVASAETLTFPMKQTEGKFDYTTENGTVYGQEVTKVDGTTDTADGKLVVVPSRSVVIEPDGKGHVYDITDSVSKPKITIKGLKSIGVGTNVTAVEATNTVEMDEKTVSANALANIATIKAEGLSSIDPKYTKLFDKDGNGLTEKVALLDDTGAEVPESAAKDKLVKVWVKDIYATQASLGSFVAREWSEIREVKVSSTASTSGVGEKAYSDIEQWKGAWSGLATAAYVLDANGAEVDAAEAKVAYELAKNATTPGWWLVAGKSTVDKYALLEMTTAEKNATIYRHDVWKLSDTGDHYSYTDVDGSDNNQTYDDNGLGKSKYRFAGLASQVADFFNHKTNGAITMKFTLGEDAGSNWVNGGVPSTEVGLRADLEANNFALFVNYNSSTGSLQAVTSVDEKSGTVTFDISEILADLGGQTKGVVTDLYYGLNQGIKYGDPYNKTGLLVEEITLSYEDEVAEDEVIEDETVEDEVVEEEVTEEEVTEEEVTEEEEVELEEEEEEPAEEEEEEVDGEMFEEEETEEEDVNPGTGVALAVVPAMIAAAAAVVSKKRK